MNHNGKDLQGGVPLLSGKGKVGTQLSAIPRVLGKDGMMEVGIQNTPNGPVPVVTRDMYWDGEDLLDAIRDVVRDEIRAMFKDLKQAGRLDVLAGKDA